MHYHCEIVLPAPKSYGESPESDNDYVQSAVSRILSPFDENNDENRHTFWDWWVIGGRFAGTKLTSALDPEKLESFWEWLKLEGVTVSGLTAGKQRLQPEGQIDKVDAKWRELFPESGAGPCPLFAHSNDQYDSESTLSGDIARFRDLPARLECKRFIVAGQSWSDDGDWNGPLEAKFMLCQTVWNGVNHMDVAWDGTVRDALEKFNKTLEHYRDEYREKITPTADWLAVTVDYHS